MNNNEANRAASAVCISPWSSAIISLIDVSQLTSQLSPALSESGSHISPSVNCVSATYLRNDANDTNTVATSCNEMRVSNLNRLLIADSTARYHCLNRLIAPNK